MSYSPLLSPSPSASSPFPPSTFSRLPNELVQTIIESSVPHHYHSDTYTSRQSTLYSLCLVSKLFHQIAKPLLYAVVYRCYKTQADFENPLIGPEVVESEGSVSGLIREIVVESSEGLPDKVMDAIRHKVGLRSLVLHLGDIGSIDLADLSELSNLTTLQLSNLRISLSTRTSLVNLQTLNLLDIWVAPSSRLSRSFNPTLFPSLTSLAYYGGYFGGMSMSEILIPLLHQLESVSLDASTIQRIPVPLLARLEEITLFDHSDISKLSLTTITPFIRLHCLDEWPCNAPSVLAEWISKNARPGLPSVLYLPLWVKSDNSSGGSFDEETRLEKECQKKKIQLVFEDEPEEWHLESGISDEFRRRMKARKLIQSGN